MVLPSGGGRGKRRTVRTMTNYFPHQDKIRDEFTKYDTDKNGVITRGLNFIEPFSQFGFFIPTFLI